jgi:hypothetical protein
LPWPSATVPQLALFVVPIADIFSLAKHDRLNTATQARNLPTPLDTQ